MDILKQLLKRLKTFTKNCWAKIITKFGGKPVWQIEEGHVVVPAFISNGVQYYQLKDYFNTFSLRGLTALNVYEEWNMRITYEVLEEFINKLDKIVNDQKSIKISEIVLLLNMFKERQQFILPTREIIYKFASVAFFDKNESPYGYDPEYAKEKINRWKEAADVDDFFIVLQLKDMLPLPELSKEDLEICLMMIDKISEHQLLKVRS